MQKQGRCVALLLLACALLLKFPAGWMPEAHARGISIGWCNAVSPAAQIEGRKLFEAALGKRSAPKQDAALEQPCAFAAAAAQPMMLGDAVPSLLPPAYQPPLPLPRFTAAPGRGLAAPPPHATGPPLLA